MDVESLSRWDQYPKAKEAKWFSTDTADAPWTIVRSGDKKRARLHRMRDVLDSAKTISEMSETPSRRKRRSADFC